MHATFFHEALVRIIAALVSIGAAVLIIAKAKIAQEVFRVIYRRMRNRPASGQEKRGKQQASRDVRQTLGKLASKIQGYLESEQVDIGLKEKSALEIPFIVPQPATEAARGQVPQRLVILGEGGSGKTILLHKMSLTILNRRTKGNRKHRDPQFRPEEENLRFNLKAEHAAEILDDWVNSGTAGHFIPVPVIFSLSRWRGGGRIEDWMTDELRNLRYVSALGDGMARRLVDDHLILPLLDGFDEVGKDLRDALIDKLNNSSYQQFILTSRRDAFTAPASGPRRNLVNSVTVELTEIPADEAEKYLLGGSLNRPDGAPWWKNVTDEMRDSESPTGQRLAAVFNTPLMISIASEVYRDPKRDPDELLKDDFSSVREIENHILDQFIPSVYGGRDRHPSEASERRTRRTCDVATALRAFRYLASPSNKSEEPEESEEIAWWEIGTKRMSGVKRSVLTALATWPVFALALGIGVCVAVPMLKLPTGFAILRALWFASSIGLAFGFANWLSVRFKGHMLEPSEVTISLLGNSGLPRISSEAGETRRRFIHGLVIGGGAGVAGISGMSIGGVIVTALCFGPASTLRYFIGLMTPEAILALGIYSLVIALTTGIALGLSSFLEKPLETSAGAGPLDLLAASRRTALRGGTVVGIVSGVILGITDAVFDPVPSPIAWVNAIVSLGVGAIGGVILGAGGVLSLTAWGQWVIFCRVWLPLTRKLPRRTRAFLDDAQRLGVLRQNGGYFQFRHARLRERLLSDPSEPQEARRSAILRHVVSLGGRS